MNPVLTNDINIVNMANGGEPFESSFKWFQQSFIQLKTNKKKGQTQMHWNFATI